ncbi:MAG: propionyl-CoA carboxylase [Dehalococcoidia bacterium]|nr:propionyl-CoA carboxylase [Dehalococcoidia bacterium]
MSWLPEVEEIERRKALAKLHGGEERVARQHGEGKYTIRERIDRLLDAGTFTEYGSIAGSAQYAEGQLESFLPAAYVMGTGRISGRPVAVGGEDFTIRGGSGGTQMRRSKGGLGGFIEDLAAEYKLPLVLLLDGSGANVGTVKEMGHTYLPSSVDWGRSVDLLSEVPVIGAVLGSAAGGPAARAMLTHWTCMVRGQSHIFTAGPPVAKRALGEDLTKEQLGGAAIQVNQSGVIDNAVDTEDEAFEMLRRFLSFMPQNVYEMPPVRLTADRPNRRENELLEIVPRNRSRSYNMRKIVQLVMDSDCPLFEVRPDFGRCVMTFFARLNGVPVAVTAHNPMFNGGALDANGAEKLTHFLELADYFHFPVISFVDVPGFMIGSKAEQQATIRKGMRAFYMGYQMRVPQAQVIVRKCYGMAGSFRASKLNLRFAWPSAEWGSIPIEGGVDAAFKREIANADDPAKRRAEIEADLRMLRSPWGTAERFGVEEMIDPSKTREVLVNWLGLAHQSLRYQLGPAARGGVRP